METRFQRNKPGQASPEITWMDCDVFVLWSNKLYPSSINNCAAILRVHDQLQKKRPTPKPYPRKQYCVMRQTRRCCTCHHILLHEALIEGVYRHTTFHVQGWQSAKQGIVGFTVFLPACFTFPDNLH